MESLLSAIPGIAAVRASFILLPTVSRSCQWAPTLIAVGLAVLLAAAWWPAVPVVTAMALVAFGATGATLARFRGRPALLPVLLVHLAIYGALYALFVAATLHASTQGNAPVGLPAAIDLAVSVWPAVAAVGLVGDVLRDNRSAE